MRVVVIEDEDKARQLIIRLLRQADPGIQVVGEAANGDEGRALVLKQLPDLAFVDIKMPGMSGLDMIRSLQSKKMQVNSPENLGLGMANTCYRMRLYYGAAFIFSIGSKGGRGTTVTLKLPAL